MPQYLICMKKFKFVFNPTEEGGGCNNPVPNSFHPGTVLKNTQQMGKIVRVSFKFILLPHFSKNKKKSSLPPLGYNRPRRQSTLPKLVGQGGCCKPRGVLSRVFQNLVILKLLEVISTSNFFWKFELYFFNIFNKKIQKN